MPIVARARGGPAPRARTVQTVAPAITASASSARRVPMPGAHVFHEAVFELTEERDVLS